MNPIDYYFRHDYHKEKLLNDIDEYSIYEHYIEGFELNKSLHSPYREDNSPSFSVFESDREEVNQYTWYDHARGDYGDIFDLLLKMYPDKTSSEITDMIRQDIGTGFKRRVVKPKQQTTISVVPQPFTSQDIQYWNQYSISTQTLSNYNVSSVFSYSLNGEVKTPPGMMFAYKILNRYKLYSPFPKFFISNYTRDMVEGLLELPERGDILIVDKSLKDVMFCREIDFSAVAGKSESTLICEEIMLNLRSRFNRLILMLDNDEAGRKCTEKYLSKYPFLEYKFLEGAKDKTDLCKLKGKDFVKQWMNLNIKSETL